MAIPLSGPTADPPPSGPGAAVGVSPQVVDADEPQASEKDSSIDPPGVRALLQTRSRRATALVLAFLVVAGLEWLRIPGRAWNSIYAEDGNVFLQQWANDPSLGTLIRPYAGYWHLIPRLAAIGIATTPVSWWAVVTSIAAVLIVAGIVVLIWVLSRDVFTAWWARGTAALIPLLLPMARFEAVADLNNLHAYMVYLLIFVLLARPRSYLGANLLMLVAFLAAGTEIVAAFLLPLAIIAVRRDHSRTRPFVGWACGIAVQAWVYASTYPPRGGGFTNIGSGFLGWAVNSAAATVVEDTQALGRIVLSVGWWPILLVLAVFVGCAVLAVVTGRSEVRLLGAVVVPLSAALWAASYFLNNHVGMLYGDVPTADEPAMPLTRWGIAAGMVLVLAVPLAGQAMAAARPRLAWVGVTGCAALLVVMAVWFDRGTTAREQPDWSPAVAAARSTCAETGAATVSIPIMNWGEWTVVVPCSLL